MGQEPSIYSGYLSVNKWIMTINCTFKRGGAVEVDNNTYIFDYTKTIVIAM